MIGDGIRGLTSNPTIFMNAIAGSELYDDQIRAHGDESATAIFEALAIDDITAAADELRGVYDASSGGDGFVSLEVSPHLAHDARGTVADAVRLWNLVNRPNLMIKVPATPAGVIALPGPDDGQDGTPPDRKTS